MVKRGIFKLKEEYKELPYFSNINLRKTPITDKLILDKVFGKIPLQEQKPFSELLKEIGTNITLKGFVDSSCMDVFEGVKEHFSQDFKSNLFALRQTIDPRHPYFNEIVYFYLDFLEIDKNDFNYNDNLFLEIEGKIKLKNGLPYTKYIHVEKIKELPLHNLFPSKPPISYKKLVDIFKESYKSENLAEAIIINLISSPKNKRVNSPLILPLNKTLSPNINGTVYTKHDFQNILLNDLRLLFNPTYFKSNNPLFSINWMGEGDIIQNSNKNSLNICFPKHIMNGDEFYNKKALYPIFLYPGKVEYYKTNTFLDLNQEIKTSLAYYKFLPKKYNLTSFNKEDIRLFKENVSIRKDKDLKFFLGACSNYSLNNPSVHARTGGNYRMGISLNKITEFPNKEVKRIYQDTLITEFEDVISEKIKLDLINHGIKFMRIPNNNVRTLIKTMNDIISTGESMGIPSNQIEDLLMKSKLRLEHLKQAIELGIIVSGFKGLRPHHYHLEEN